MSEKPLCFGWCCEPSEDFSSFREKCDERCSWDEQDACLYRAIELQQEVEERFPDKHFTKFDKNKCSAGCNGHCWKCGE